MARDLPQPPKLLDNKRVPGKLLVVETVAHVLPDRQPTVLLETRYTRWLGSDTPPYLDEFVADGNWQRVQTGRISASGMTTIQNLEGTDLVVVPTPGEREDLATRVLGVLIWPGNDPPDREFLLPSLMLVNPGESARFRPAPGTAVWVRSEHKMAAVRVRVGTAPA